MKVDPSSISIYPNPAKDNISIYFNDFEGNNPVDVSIFNINGKLIMHKVINDENHITIKINKFLTSGMYFIRVQSNIKTIIQKLIINEN